MNKILIIGGAGYIGSHQVRVMCDNNYEVIVVDNLSTGHKDAIDKRAKFIQGDIRDYEFISKVLKEEQPKGIIHFAALSLVGFSMEIPLDYYNNNVYGMEVLLRAMNDTNIKNIVFSSSAAVYGNHDKMPINEDYLCNPTSAYGETKLVMERMMKYADIAYGIKYVALRYFNAAGNIFDGSLGERHNPETHLIPLILQVPLGQRENIKIFGNDYKTKDGTCIRDYIHVLDLCSAHTLAIESLINGKDSNIYNLGYGEGTSVQEIIEVAEKVVGKEIKKEIAPRRAGDPDQLVASNEKIIKELGWKPEYNDLEKIIDSAYTFFKRRNNQ